MTDTSELYRLMYANHGKEWKGMGEEMKEYDPDEECPKCGYLIIKDTFIPKTHQRVNESIERKCVRCGYVWHERPLDADGEEQ